MQELYLKKIFSVDELTSHIKKILSLDKTLKNFQVKGEISNFRHPRNNHLYFNLKDGKAIIKCVMFKEDSENLQFTPKEGTEVIIDGYIGVYKERGEYQIYVNSMQLAGQGMLYLKYLQLKDKLEKEGLFQDQFKKPIPKMPKKIGVVASLDGAVIEDIKKTIKKRFPFVNIIVYPSQVQGNDAKYQIERGINVLNHIEVDVIIVARGGGSFEDLFSFNEENVARAIFNSKIPIITGIGHETDHTIADFVADKRAHTPTAAAELAVPDIIEINNSLLNLKKRLKRDLNNAKENYRRQLSNVQAKTVFRKPSILISPYLQKLDEKQTDLIQQYKNKINILKNDISIWIEKLNASDPRSILSKGYSITLAGNRVINTIKDIKQKDIISTILPDGEIKSEVK